MFLYLIITYFFKEKKHRVETDVPDKAYKIFGWNMMSPIRIAAVWWTTDTALEEAHVLQRDGCGFWALVAYI